MTDASAGTQWVMSATTIATVSVGFLAGSVYGWEGLNLLASRRVIAIHKDSSDLFLSIGRTDDYHAADLVSGRGVSTGKRPGPVPEIGGSRWTRVIYFSFVFRKLLQIFARLNCLVFVEIRR